MVPSAEMHTCARADAPEQPRIAPPPFSSERSDPGEGDALESPKASQKSEASTTPSQSRNRRHSFQSVDTAGSFVSIMEHRVSGEKHKPGIFSLHTLVVSALVGTSVISCGSVLIIMELSTGVDEHAMGLTAALAVSGLIVAASLALGLVISTAILQPMLKISRLVDLLSEKDGALRSDTLLKLRGGDEREGGRRRTSFIKEVGRLQDASWRLSQGVEMFTRYVPDAVVRSIVRGDEKATQLHVFRRKVTIMFSDIKDFTTISESLSQEELLFVLTRYLSVMTKVIESYKGVVAEILGDGLLVYWNTPDDVKDPEMKACAAAMAQQQVLVNLNEEFQRLKMPEIAIRIGLHSGKVLSGTIGSESKMKFGCLGDPVNTAARLEGLCKVYGVSTICSGEVFEGLPASSGFLLRELDMVQVKGRKGATRLFEVIGVENSDAFKEQKVMATTAQTAMRESTAALSVSEVLRVNPIRRRASFFKVGPYSLEGIQEAALNHHSFLSPNSSLGSANNSNNRLWDEVTPEAVKHVELYEAALHEYQKANLVEAKDFLSSFLKTLPEDQAGVLLMGKIDRHLDPYTGELAALSPEERASWTGITVLNEK